MILQNGKLSEEFDILMNQIFFTFARWELYENLEKIINDNKFLEEAILKNKFDFHAFKFLLVSLGKDILISLWGLLRDERAENLSLLRILIEIEKRNPEVKSFKEILKGNFSNFSSNLQKNIETFSKEIEKIQNLKDLQSYLKDLLNLVKEINLFLDKSLLKNIEKVKKLKKIYSNYGTIYKKH
jgi:hypothetical protein